ncbi:MAG: sulfatase-like hydrolase/transferase, partial [Myxococcota bacterium]
MSVLLALLLLAGAAQSDEGRAPASALDRISAVKIELPVNDATAPQKIPITGPWRLVMTHAGVRTWEAPMPVRPRTLFYHNAPGDMTVYQDGRPLNHEAFFDNSHKDRSWSFSNRALQVRRRIQDGAPSPGEYAVRYSMATTREADLRYTGAPDDLTAKQSFVARSAQLDDTSRSGLYLPAPAMAEFSIDVPSGAVLDLTPVLLPPEAGDPVNRSDGARVTVFVNDERVVSWRIDEGVSARKRVLLSPWAGEDVHIRIASEVGRQGDASLDYVFVADPVVFVPSMDPRRVVLLFIDTLRSDHLSLYGYDRPTTPRLDAWAADAAVFEQARSIAPWTLPSSRTMMTGAIPERWARVETIQGALSKAGWATTFIAGNVYLSSKFEIARGWASHRCINWPLANVQVDRALDYLNENSDRDTFVMLHFMDMHLPYTEPPAYRYL